MSDLRIGLILEAIDRMTSPMRRIGQATRQAMGQISSAARQAAERMEGLSQRATQLQNAGQRLALRVTAPLAAFGGLALKAAADFEASMNTVQVLTGATGDRFERLRSTARDLGETTQFSASQAAGAMAALAQAGYSTEEILAAIPGALQLAAAGQLDLATATQLATGILAGARLEKGELGRVNDVLAKTMTSTKSSFLQIAEAMSYAGTVAADMGLDFEETAAALGLMHNANIEGSRAGTALRASLGRLAKQAPEVKRTLAGLGIRRDQLYDSEGNLRSLTDVVRVLGEAGASTGDLMRIFGEEAGPAMAALIGAGSDALVELTEKLRSSAGTAQRVADVQMQGAIGGIRKLRSAWEGLQIAVADSGLLQWLTQIVEKLTEFIGWLARLDPRLLRIASIFGIVAAAIPPLLMMLGTLGFAIKGTVIGFAALKAGGLALAVGLGPAIAAVKAFGAALLATPVGWILAAIAAIAGAVYVIYDNWDAVAGYFRALWDRVKAAFDEGFLQGVVALLVEFNPVKLIGDAVNGLVQYLTGIDLKQVGIEWIGGLVDGIRDMVPDLQGMIDEVTSWLPDWMLDWIRGEEPEPLRRVRNEEPPRGAPAGAGSAARVGGTVRIQVEGPARVREVRSDSRDVDLDVDSGLFMVGGGA